VTCFVFAVKNSSLSHLTSILSTLTSHCLRNDSVVTSVSGQSPDSGLREMSSEGGGSVFANTPNDTSWYSALAATTLTPSALNFDESQIDQSERSDLMAHISTVHQNNMEPDSSEINYAKAGPVPSATTMPFKHCDDGKTGTGLVTMNESDASFSRQLDSFDKLFNHSLLFDCETLSNNTENKQNSRKGMQPLCSFPHLEAT